MFIEQGMLERWEARSKLEYATSALPCFQDFTIGCRLSTRMDCSGGRQVGCRPGRFLRMSSAITSSRVSTTFPAIRLELWICLVLACAPLPTAVARAKLAGKVLDAAALSKVRTYCVDTSNLKGPVYPGDIPDPEASDVRELVTTERGPKGLLAMLPWKLEAGCSGPGVDAIVRFDFRAIVGGMMVGPVPPNSAPVEWPPPGQPQWRAELQVTDKASSRATYKAEGNPLDQRSKPTALTQAQLDHLQRRDAAYHALAALVSDVKTISKNP